jgi:hypothetical protein
MAIQSFTKSGEPLNVYSVLYIPNHKEVFLYYAPVRHGLLNFAIQLACIKYGSSIHSEPGNLLLSVNG